MTTEPVVLARGPTLELRGAVLRLRDGTHLPELDVTVDGDRVALVGASGAVFGLLRGEVELAHGHAEVLGTNAAHAVARGVLGLALLDPPYPEKWTAERYLVESARLLGLPKRRASERAHALLQSFGLSHLANRVLALLPVFERRAFALAHATLAEPAAICCEAPLEHLEGEALAYVSARLDKALAGRRALVGFRDVPATGPERAWIDRADSLVIFEGERILASGSPQRVLGGSPRVLATVTRRSEEFSSALEELGISAEPVGTLASLLPALSSAEGATLTRFLITLPDSTDTRPILEAARKAGAPLVELRPLVVTPRAAAARTPGGNPDAR